MTQLSDKDRKAQMADTKSFDEQMPCVGSLRVSRVVTEVDAVNTTGISAMAGPATCLNNPLKVLITQI